jgi:alpha-tubulin suppressor-like RCC1 family protein
VLTGCVVAFDSGRFQYGDDADAALRDGGLDAGTSDARVVDAGEADAHELDARTDADAAACVGECTWTCDSAGCDEPVDIAAGFSHTCVRTRRGRVYCAGKNEFGQLGDGTVDNRTRWVRVADLDDAIGICAGGEFSCAVRETGRIVCWGQNDMGQLGTGAVTPLEATPRPVAGILNAEQVACGGYHACARGSGGAIDCWGFGVGGQLGDGRAESSASPRRIQPAGVVASDVAGGLLFSCAAQADGVGRCWGWNEDGQLGNGTFDQSNTARAVADLTGISRVRAGAAHTCAVDGAGVVWCWGNNTSGQCGDPSAATRKERPFRVTALPASTLIATGSAHTCASDDAVTRCWGSGFHGALGDGTQFDRRTFVVASGVPALISIAAGSQFTCGVTTDARVLCWGENEFGQLADGTTTFRLTYVEAPPPG